MVGLAVALVLAAPAWGQSKASPAGKPAVQIDNFGRINDYYYRGAQPRERDLADLVKLGIKTTIDLTNGDGNSNERRLAESAGLKFFKIPMSTHVIPTPAEIAQFLNIVMDPTNQPVYVHCVGGKHRTGVMTAIYRMIEDKWTPDRAFQEMKAYKFGADFLHPEFKQFVFGFNPAVAATAVASPAGGER